MSRVENELTVMVLATIELAVSVFTNSVLNSNESVSKYCVIKLLNFPVFANNELVVTELNVDVWDVNPTRVLTKSVLIDPVFATILLVKTDLEFMELNDAKRPYNVLTVSVWAFIEPTINDEMIAVLAFVFRTLIVLKIPTFVNRELTVFVCIAALFAIKLEVWRLLN